METAPIQDKHEQQTPESLEAIIQSISAKGLLKTAENGKLCACQRNYLIYENEAVCRQCQHEAAEKKYSEERRLDEWETRKKSPEMFMQGVGVGKRYLGATLENFNGGEKYVSFCREWFQAPSSLYLYGPCGCGKTHLATSLCRGLITQKIKHSIQFVNASDLFLSIRKSFNDKSAPQEADIVNRLATKDFLFVDDIGAEKTSEFSRATIYLIIDRRDREMLPTIITSNLSPAQLGAVIDKRISSRIANGKIVEIKMPDYRLRRG